MPLVALIWSGLLSILGSVVGTIVAKIGIGVVTYTGISASLTFLKTQAVSSLSGLPAEMIGLLAYMKVGESISIVASALVVRLTLGGMNSSGVLSKFIKK